MAKVTKHRDVNPKLSNQTQQTAIVAKPTLSMLLKLSVRKYWAVVVAQLAKRSLPTPETRGSTPDIRKLLREQ